MSVLSVPIYSKHQVYKIIFFYKNNCNEYPVHTHLDKCILHNTYYVLFDILILILIPYNCIIIMLKIRNIMNNVHCRNCNYYFSLVGCYIIIYIIYI